MAQGRDLRGILFVLAVLFGTAVVWRDLRYDFAFSSDMRAAEISRRTKEVTLTSTVQLTETATVLETVQLTEAPVVPDPPEKASAAFVILTRNKDLKDLRETLVQLEDRFNRRYNYPYVFLNNEPFSDEFKERVADVVSGECRFGLIPKEHWSYPDYINQTRAAEARKDMEQRKIIYGGSESYRHMCRYESGFFFRHPLMEQYSWYWRVEPGVKFGCDIDYDPFMFMQQNGKKYGFTITIKEYIETIPTLWNTTKRFMSEHKDLIPASNLLDFVTDKDGGYNRCHFWSNFEIGSLDFLRSERYLAYFDHLDRAGGFFYERWGDAPVHSLGVAMFLGKDEVHWFEDIGYYHGPLWNCPKGATHKAKKCWCPPEESIETKNKHWSCTLDFVALGTTTKK
ncbi:alpha-1,2-mannosyltransferase ktr1 [Coemansia javaensis]|uniref:Alpha-1,2-mannosyltransferase ktr1 n=1 Tax=Coemansia javaensis TaxID=2761396 RepID=A0A9W8LIF2_9FUNG|nr:alpha-1,2-mannosyltransferase ktr1 [Coemansia javaensis]